MACLQVARYGFSPSFTRRPGLSSRRFGVFSCGQQENSSSSNGKEPPESLFMKELKRRGMTPTSLLEEGKRGVYELGEKEMEEEKGGESRGQKKKKRNGVMSAEYEMGVSGQRERSIALNSEGLEGLIPRAKVLLAIGGTFFLGFWPLILIMVASFAALYLYFGPSFVHDASKTQISPPPYVDPYALLEEERISPIAPRLK